MLIINFLHQLAVLHFVDDRGDHTTADDIWEATQALMGSDEKEEKDGWEDLASDERIEREVDNWLGR